MLEHDLVSGENGLAQGSTTLSAAWLDLPDCVVGRFVEKADLLVAGEASEGKRRDGLRAQEQGLVADEFVGLEANLLTVADHVVAGRATLIVAAAHDVKDGASAGTNSLFGRSHSIGLVVARDAIAHVTDEPSVSEAVLHHDGVTEAKRVVLTVSVRDLIIE